MIGDRVLQHEWVVLLKVQDLRSVWELGTVTKFKEHLMEEGSPDLTLVVPRRVERSSDQVYGNDGQEILGTEIIFLVIDQQSGTRGSNTRHGMDYRGGPGPSPGLTDEIWKISIRWQRST